MQILIFFLQYLSLVLKAVSLLFLLVIEYVIN